jgi:hypothetical protein
MLLLRTDERHRLNFKPPKESLVLRNLDGCEECRFILRPEAGSGLF